MRYKHLIISIIIVALIIISQAAFLYTLYDNFRKECKDHLEEAIFLSINKEYRRRVYNDSGKLLFEPIDEMSVARRDSLLNIAPLPPNPPKFDVEDLTRKGIIRTSAEIGQQYNQDIYYDSGKEIDLSKLDSIFITMSNVDYPHTLALVDNVKNTTRTTNSKSLTSYRYKLRPFYIGIQARQIIFLYYDISLSSFLKETLLIIISSILMLCAALILAMIQIGIIRQNKKIVQQMRENINGTVHDLKTPLSGVIMTLNLAKANTENEQIKNIFSISLSSVHHLIGNIDSLLSVARKNNTLHKEDITTLELLGIIGTIVSDLDNIYTMKPHTIEVNNLLPNGTKLNVDKLHFGNILRNLLDNAIKYADNGVKVKLSITPIPNAIKFTVEDNGYGIPKRYHRKIFQHFYRVETTATTQRGYGVGLSQVKQLVEKHGGKISLQSKEGQGTTFTFSIPN